MSKEAGTGLFITGTDTEIGKTYVTSLIIKSLAKVGKRVAGMKPIASGFEYKNGDWQNDDVESIKAAINIDMPQKLINRYAFKPAVAPHIACANSGSEIDLNLIAQDYHQCLELADVVVVEGVGGWQVPLGQVQQGGNYDTVADLAATIAAPVVLVVGIRLGCINHALLTAQAIQSDGLNLIAWVANCVDPDMQEQQANIETLKRILPAPHMATVPYKGSLDQPDLCSQFTEWMARELV